MPTRGSVAKSVREDRERKPWRYYGRKSLWRAKVGDYIISLDGATRGTVVYDFAHPSNEGEGITVKLTGMRDTVVVNANRFRHENQKGDC